VAACLQKQFKAKKKKKKLAKFQMLILFLQYGLQTHVVTNNHTLWQERRTGIAGVFG
jgi:hypothetical protein